MNAILEGILNFIGEIFPMLDEKQKGIVLFGLGVVATIIIVALIVKKNQSNLGISNNITSGNDSIIIIGKNNKIKR